MSGSMGVHGAHTHVRGKPQVSVPDFCLVWDRVSCSLVLMPGWLACEFLGNSVSISLLTVRALGLQVRSPASSFTWIWGTWSLTFAHWACFFPSPLTWRILAFRLPRIYTANIEGGARLDRQLTTYQVWRILITDIVGIFWDWVADPTRSGISES